MESQAFKNWINEKYRDWWNQTDRKDATITNFAKMIGVSRQVVDKWVNRGSIPEPANIAKIAVLFPDIYQVLELSPTPDAKKAIDFFVNYSSKDVQQLLDAMLAAEAEIARRGVDRKSVEGERIVRFFVEGTNIFKNSQ